MKRLAIAFALLATPALAEPENFVSLKNPEFVVLIGFLLFLALLVYLKVPGLLGGLLDKRAEGIKSDLAEAKALREDAQAILASYERQQREVKDQAERIVEHAKAEAIEAAEKAKQDLKASIARRLAAAEDQITSAQDAAVKEVRDTAIQVAVAAASDVITAKMTASSGSKLIDEAIQAVGEKLH